MASDQVVGVASDQVGDVLFDQIVDVVYVHTEGVVHSWAITRRVWSMVGLG